VEAVISRHRKTERPHRIKVGPQTLAVCYEAAVQSNRMRVKRKGGD